jgi:SAM-dependent methyltransferase
MLTDAHLPNATRPPAGNPDFSSNEAYLKGFTRCLALRSNSNAGPKYSEEFQESLRAYFESYGLLDHPKLPDWWTDHFGARVAHAFNSFIPWCQELSVNFEGARVLEIGCGTGSSTVALAAHSRCVLACDIHRPSLNAARIRLKEDGFAHKVTFLLLDPELEELSALTGKFDLVVLYGVLEHMLPEEREKMFRAIWDVLDRRGRIILYETPNRLWPKDHHTTGLVGWSWLPPSWALRYGRWRGKFDSETDLVRMRRLGYGITYAELLNLLRGCGAKHAIRFKYVREPFYQRLLIKVAVALLRAPRWGFSENLNIVIERI